MTVCNKIKVSDIQNSDILVTLIAGKPTRNWLSDQIIFILFIYYENLTQSTDKNKNRRKKN